MKLAVPRHLDCQKEGDLSPKSKRKQIYIDINVWEIIVKLQYLMYVTDIENP